MKYTIINANWKHEFYSFSMKLSVLNLHIWQVCLWNDCQNIYSNARSLYTWCLTTERRCQVTWLPPLLILPMSTYKFKYRLVQIRLKFQIYIVVYLCMCVYVWVCGVERYKVYVFIYVWRYAYVTLYATMLRYRFQLWQNLYRVVLRMKQVRGKWDKMFQLLGIRRKPPSRMWYHVASWTDAKVSKECAALNSQLHSAAYSKTSVTTLYHSPLRRHTQEDVNFKEKFSQRIVTCV